MKFLKIFLSLVVILAIGGVIVTNLTPWPVSMLVRSQFESLIMQKPHDYEFQARNVLVVKNQNYPSGYKDNLFDVYFPKENKELDFPVIIWTHGGGGIGGDKKDIEYMATMLAANGYVVFSINYERAPESLYPNQIKQLQEFSNYLPQLENHYPIDITSLFFAGDSAGAQITSQFIASQTNKKLADRTGFKQTLPMANVKGVLLFCGFYDLESITENNGNWLSKFFLKQMVWGYTGIKEPQGSQLAIDMNVMKNLTAQFPPTFVTDGNTGSFEPQAKELVIQLQKNNIPVESLFFDKNQAITSHEYQFIMNNEAGELAFKSVLRFLEKYR